MLQGLAWGPASELYGAPQSAHRRPFQSRPLGGPPVNLPSWHDVMDAPFLQFASSLRLVACCWVHAEAETCKDLQSLNIGSELTVGSASALSICMVCKMISCSKLLPFHGGRVNVIYSRVHGFKRVGESTSCPLLLVTSVWEIQPLRLTALFCKALCC